MSLKELRLNDTVVSDAAVTFLEQLTNLRILHLSGTNLTEAGILELEDALPNCQIGSPEFNRRVVIR